MGQLTQKVNITVESSNDDDFEIPVRFNEGSPSLCMACGERLKSASLLICKDCLGDECDEFLSLVGG